MNNRILYERCLFIKDDTITGGYTLKNNEKKVFHHYEDGARKYDTVDGNISSYVINNKELSVNKPNCPDYITILNEKYKDSEKLGKIITPKLFGWNICLEFDLYCSIVINNTKKNIKVLKDNELIEYIEVYNRGGVYTVISDKFPSEDKDGTISVINNYGRKEEYIYVYDDKALLSNKRRIKELYINGEKFSIKLDDYSVPVEMNGNSLLVTDKPNFKTYKSMIDLCRYDLYEYLHNKRVEYVELYCEGKLSLISKIIEE